MHSDDDKLRAHKYLDSHGIPYESIRFPEQTERDLTLVAGLLSDRVSPRQVTKTLLFETSAKEVVLVIIGADQNVISGRLKKVVGDRDIRLASRERVRDVTGYEVGAIPPFSWQPPGFRTFVDSSLLSEPVLAVGAGQWGHEILLTPSDLVRAASAQYADLTKVPSQ